MSLKEGAICLQVSDLLSNWALVRSWYFDSLSKIHSDPLNIVHNLS